MLEGLWIVQYVGMTGHDSGTVVLVNGGLYGGDNGFVYRGTYAKTETGIRARVHVHNFNPAVASILNIPGDYTIDADLRFLNSETLQGNASLLDPQGVGIVLKLTKYCELT